MRVQTLDRGDTSAVPPEDVVTLKGVHDLCVGKPSPKVPRTPLSSTAYATEAVSFSGLSLQLADEAMAMPPHLYSGHGAADPMKVSASPSVSPRTGVAMDLR